MNKVITLTTDFGHKGPFVAVMKGVIAQRISNVQVIDLTHEILVHWPVEAGFWLARSYKYFPTGSVHIAVIDPGVGTERDIIAAEYDEHIFLAPNNGLLPPVFANSSKVKFYKMSEEWRCQQNWPSPSNTFHGRDIFAPLAADICAGLTKPADIGPRL